MLLIKIVNVDGVPSFELRRYSDDFSTSVLINKYKSYFAAFKSLDFLSNELELFPSPLLGEVAVVDVNQLDLVEEASKLKKGGARGKV